ncbi:MAG TPA: SH3 domain-containing protein [Methyloceanibacter sp.]|nr:SH3 domain-containing protein [Methyloceanibacter sp.]
MKRLLLSACLVGVVFAGYPPHPLHTNQVTPAAADASNERAVSIVPKSRTVERVAYRPSALTDPAQQGALKGSPLEPTVEEMFKPALLQTPEGKVANTDEANQDEAADQNAMWVKVIRGAMVHSGPSVSAPVVSHFAIGTELHLIDSQQGWFQVFDPATGERGWVYAKYYVEPIDRPSGKRVVAVQEPQAPVEAAPAPATTPPKAVRHVLQQPNFLAPPQVKAERSRPFQPWLRDGSVASLLDRALRR